MFTSRRSVLGQLTIGSGGLALGCGGPQRGADEAQSSSTNPPDDSLRPRARITREHEPQPLPFDPATLTGLSERLIRSHHENNYAGAVRKLNACRQQLASAPADLPGFVWGGLTKSELTFANSVLLHELYFQNLGGGGADRPATVNAALAHAFEDEASWQADFRRCAMSLAGGSGWVILAYDAHRQELAHRVCSDHGHAGAFDVPLLVLDMYEHSYHIDHGADASRYVEAFLSNVSWQIVESRLAGATG